MVARLQFRAAGRHRPGRPGRGSGKPPRVGRRVGRGAELQPARQHRRVQSRDRGVRGVPRGGLRLLRAFSRELRMPTLRGLRPADLEVGLRGLRRQLQGARLRGLFHVRAPVPGRAGRAERARRRERRRGVGARRPGEGVSEPAELVLRARRLDVLVRVRERQ